MATRINLYVPTGKTLGNTVMEYGNRVMLSGLARVNAEIQISAIREKMVAPLATIKSMEEDAGNIIDKAAYIATITNLKLRVSELEAQETTIRENLKAVLALPEIKWEFSEKDKEFRKAWNKALTHEKRMEAASLWFKAWGIPVEVDNEELDEIVRFIENPRNNTKSTNGLKKVVLHNAPMVGVGKLSLDIWFCAMIDLFISKGIFRECNVPQELRDTFRSLEIQKEEKKSNKRYQKWVNGKKRS